MILQSVFLRWYKSFNEAFTENDLPWNKVGEKIFTYVEIPVDERITTIVGANESGKSHLLSAVAKAINGHGIDRESNRALVVEDICRHCSFDSVSFEAFPNIGLKIQFEGRTEDDNFQAFMTGLGQSNPTGRQEDSILVFLDGLNEDRFASIYSMNGDLVGQIPKDDWYAHSTTRLPLLQYIDAKLMLNNEIYIDHLLNAYSPDDFEKHPIRTHLSLNATADELVGLSIPDSEDAIGSLSGQLTRMQSEINNHKIISNPKTAKLEKQLFDDVLDVSQPCLERIKKVGWTDRGYMELVLSDINRRIEQRLDLSNVWTQDEDIILEVDYKDGFFYFHLKDKTGCKFTFNERSSGLRYFLSYYIQSLAYKKANTDRGTIVLMDEPDGFLSAVAQRNLLRVFESLANSSNNAGRCQLLYTTHSPFLINRNFPQRVRLVRKGDGNEGTQFVEKSQSRRYEPIRSALGIDCAETIFMGATNVVLEGMADQKVLVAALQKFGEPDTIDETIDLNAVTFVSANGAPSVKRILQQTISNDDKKPIFVVVLDGDGEGQKVINEIEAEGLADKDAIATLSDFKIAADGEDEPKVLEDLIPLKMLASATRSYLKSYWNEDMEAADCLAKLTAGNDPICKKLEKVVKEKAGAEAKNVDGYEIRGGITDAFIENVLDCDEFAASEELTAFKDTTGKLVLGIKKLIENAEAMGRREKLKKINRHLIDTYIKMNRDEATKYDVAVLLRTLNDQAIIGGDSSGQAQTNISQMQTWLEEEAKAASHAVDADKWRKRLDEYMNNPFKKMKKA